MDKQLSMVVLPDATPPATRTEALFSMAYQKYAAISGDSVLKLIRSEIVRGSTRKRRMVNVEPRLVISFPYVSWMRLPSGRDASNMGAAMEMFFPERYANLTMKEFSSFSSLKMMLVGRDSYSRCQM